MRQTIRSMSPGAWTVLIAAVAFVPLLAGCGEAAQAKPLEVTYYYMPG